MQIKKLAAATGVDADTIRFYEKQGLLPAPARLANGYRNYGGAHLERLSFIRHCRALEKQLVQLRARCAVPPVSGEACGILAELVSAAHGEACACHPEAPATPDGA